MSLHIVLHVSQASWSDLADTGISSCVKYVYSAAEIISFGDSVFVSVC